MDSYGIQCFISCLVNAGLVIPLIGLFTAVAICLVFYIVSRRYESLLGAQSFMSVIISVNLLSMNCNMFTWFWMYLGIILIGTIIIMFVKNLIQRYVVQKNIGSISSLSDIESEFNVHINVIDSSKIRAFVFMKKIYLSVGLLERLEKNEIRAVVAHELYHLNHSPNKIMSTLLAITSLTFRRHSDEYSADSFAANVSGMENLINALKKLNIKDSEKRIRTLSYY
jgi:heat shock protein HtpX